jgi:hypothetical protein
LNRGFQPRALAAPHLRRHAGQTRRQQLANSWRLPSNNSFKPKPLRSSKNHGKKSLPCFCFHYAFRLNSGVRAHQATDRIKNNNRLAVRVRDKATRFFCEMWLQTWLLQVELLGSSLRGGGALDKWRHRQCKRSSIIRWHCSAAARSKA